jgi:RHS repeat-associated protein
VNNYLYNSASEFNSSAGWYETAARGYDPVLGRMNGVDPMAGKFSSLTPYNYAFNMPNMVNDPSGAMPPVGGNGGGSSGSDDGSGSGILEATMWYEGQAQRKIVMDLARYGYVNNDHGTMNRMNGTYNLTFGWAFNQGATNWSAGYQYSDWSPNEGSALYQQGLAAGLRDLGGALYKVGDDGGLTKYTDSNGELGHWTTTFFPAFATENGHGVVKGQFQPAIKSVFNLIANNRPIRLQGESPLDIRDRFGGDFDNDYGLNLLFTSFGVDESDVIYQTTRRIEGGNPNDPRQGLKRHTLQDTERRYDMRLIQYQILIEGPKELMMLKQKDIVPVSEWTNDPIWGNPSTLDISGSNKLIPLKADNGATLWLNLRFQKVPILY